MSQPMILPVANIQHDFLDVIADVNEGRVASEDIWISCYLKNGEPSSIHSKARVSLDEVDRSLVRLETLGGVGLRRENRDGQVRYAIDCPQLEVPFTDVLPPKAILRSPEKSSVVKAITAFDVAPDGLLVATGYLDGSVHVHNPSAPPTSAQLQRARPHLSSVNALRFFPSSRVLLTAGNDFTLCILPADPAPADASAPPAALSPVRTLRAHKRAVTDAAILGRGQNVLSAAKDGTVRLWDVAAGAQIRALAAAGYAPVLALAAGPRAAAAFVPAADGGVAPAAPAGTAEVGTADMLAFGALGDGTFEAFDVAAGHAVFRSPDRGAALTAIDYSPARNLVATGAADGAVRVWDTRMLDAPVTSFTRGTAGIEGIAFVDVLPTAAGSADASEAGLVVTTVDGLPYVANVRAERPPRVVAELVGADCDRVGIVRVRGHGAWGAAAENTSELWLAADDGVLRTY